MERRLAFISGEGDLQGKRMVAADVLVEPTLVDEREHAYLRLQAIHVRTGSMLGHMKLAIDAECPGRLDLGLDERLARWWPGVLVNLQRAQSLPIVCVRAVYHGPADARQSQRLRNEMHEALARQSGCFVAQYRTTVNTQTEALMQTMGLSSSRAGCLTAACDYVLEGQLLSDRRVELRILRPTGGGEMARGVVEGASFHAMISAASDWIARHGALLAKRPDPVEAPSAANDWSARQAREEFQVAERCRQEIESAVGRTDEKSPERLALIADVVRRYLTAHHLDPTNEEIAYRVLEFAGRYGDLDFDDSSTLMEVAGRYLLTFPHSQRDLRALSPTLYRGLVLHFSGRAGEGFRHAGLPEWMEKYERQVPELEARLQAYRVLAEWIIRATKGVGDLDRFPRFWMDHYLTALVEYLRLTRVSDGQLSQVVGSWGRRYDAHPQVVPPSEFLRLGALVARGDKRGALEQFAKMIRQRPEPADKFWTFLRRDSVGDIVAGIDQKLRDEARRWLDGKVHTDGLAELVRRRLVELDRSIQTEPGSPPPKDSSMKQPALPASNR
jgi:hypothetical protein